MKRPSIKKGVQVSAAVMSLATPFVAHEEGLRLHAYLDSVGVATICYGETDGVRMGDVMTKPECDALLYMRLGVFAMLVDALIVPEMKPQFHAALASWAYNVGAGAARSSTLVKKANAGDFLGACNELPRWRYAGGQPILLGRRLRERNLCLEGVPDAEPAV